MNHLGLRIFRFYIKCTACLSEISFRTDPANTDYVLEAGATRNFEALSRAAKIAEQRQKAYQEELRNNPMKLLEERTEASKNDMDRVEALVELQELNRREGRINFEDMLSNYYKLGEKDVAKAEAEDEEFVKKVFGIEGGVKIKRLLEDNQNDDLENHIGSVTKAKVNKVTDFLTDGKTTFAKKEVWEKSVETRNIKKGSLVVAKKKSTQNINIETTATTSRVPNSSIAPSSITLSLPTLRLGLLGARYSHFPPFGAWPV